mgnify:CR=1 FL=1
MSSVTEAWKAWQEGLANKDSSKLGEFFTDDFQFVSASGTRNKQETLDWTAAGGNPTVLDDLEVLYENDDVAVVHHTTPSLGANGLIMALYTKRDGKSSQVRLVRQEV